MWKLISYSEVKLPLHPYLSDYIVGVIENDDKERAIVRIDSEHERNISLGVEGEINRCIGPKGEVNTFVPFLKCREESEKEKISKKIENVGIIGTGPMGYQLAQFILQHGFNVTLKSRSKEHLDRALKKIEDGLLMVVSPEEKSKILENLNLATEFEELADRDIIIECAREDEKTKEEIFKELDKICSKDTILATNTSSLSINAFTSNISNPNRVVGTHFFNPVDKMKLVEIIRGKDTTTETIDLAKKFMKELDKTPFVFDNIPGFVVNRILFSMINEAAYLLKESKATIEEIDTAIKLGTNFPMGPFELADFIGIDVTHEIIRQISLSIPNFKPPAEIFEELIDSGKLGRKTKEGFYKY